MGPTWGRQGLRGPHVGPMNLAIWVIFYQGKTGYLVVVSITVSELSKIISRKYTMPEITFIVRMSSWNFVRFGHTYIASSWNAHKFRENILESSRNVSETPPGQLIPQIWSDIIVKMFFRHQNTTTIAFIKTNTNKKPKKINAKQSKTKQTTRTNNNNNNDKFTLTPLVGQCFEWTLDQIILFRIISLACWYNKSNSLPCRKQTLCRAPTELTCYNIAFH